MHLWDRLLPQAVITLNMLGTSRINPKLSAATLIYGQFDFNRAPMAPHTWNPPIYVAKTQFVEDETTSPALSDKDVNKLKQLTGTILYYARAVDPTLIMPINVLASEQSKATAVTA
jgi:hypothetical protein